MTRFLSGILLCFLIPAVSFAQNDSTGKRVDSAHMVPVDSLNLLASPIRDNGKADSVLKHHSPKIAAFRSAVLPGLGQAYNRKYWKIPIVYGALGVTGAVFVYNLRNYRDLRYAYKAKYLASLPPPQTDSSFYSGIRADLVNIPLNSLRSNRDEFRKNIDYSVLVFIVFWGLNVVDATVDAHLKAFDVSPDLSFQFKAGFSEMARTNGVSLVLAFK